MVSNSKKIIDNCRPCNRNKPGAGQKKRISLFGGILLVILPKCPFCLMAFSSTIFLCSEGHTLTEEHTFTSSATLTLTVFFCLLVLAGIIFNFRDSRTKYATALALLGTAIILLSVCLLYTSD